MTHNQDVHADSAHAEAPPDPRRWLALGFICLAQFMLIIDITVVQIALPSIGTDLALDREALTWVVTTYTLFFGGLMVLGGRLADTFGARRMMLAGIVLFSLASLTAGLAGGGAMLIAARAAQGIGAALMSPAGLSIIMKTFRGPELARALGFWSAIGGVGVALGLLLSGVLTSGPGWPWVFFVNVPVGLVLLLAVPTIVRPDPARGQRPRVDVLGALVVTAATALLIYGLTGAGDKGWAAAGTLLPLVAAAVLYAGFAVVERIVRTPLVRLGLLARRQMVAGTFVILIATALMLALFFLSSLYVQRLHDFSALKTGLVFLPVAVAVTIGTQLGSHLIGRIGGRAVGGAAFLITAIGIGLLTQLPTGGNVYANLLPGFLIAAFGIGPAFVVSATTALADVPGEEAGVASGTLSTFHELGGSIGVAVVSTVAAASITSASPDASGFAAAFVVAAVAAAAAAVAALLLIPRGRTAAVGHGHGH